MKNVLLNADKTKKPTKKRSPVPRPPVKPRRKKPPPAKKRR